MNDASEENFEPRKRILELASQAGFNVLTALQKNSFDCRDFYDVGKWLFVLGATGSGKTLMALMSYFLERERAVERRYKMLFAVPYRALASQKFDEITDITQKLGLNPSERIYELRGAAQSEFGGAENRRLCLSDFKFRL